MGQDLPRQDRAHLLLPVGHILHRHGVSASLVPCMLRLVEGSGMLAAGAVRVPVRYTVYEDMLANPGRCGRFGTAQQEREPIGSCGRALVYGAPSWAFVALSAPAAWQHRRGGGAGHARDVWNGQVRLPMTSLGGVPLSALLLDS